MKTNITPPNYNTKATAFHLKSSATRCGCIFASRSVFGTVEELLAQRRIVVTNETVRQWCLTFGQTYANELRRRRHSTGDKWHMDEVLLSIRRERHYLWRAVDQDGNVLDMRVAEPTEQTSGETIFRAALLKRVHYVPCVIITDKLKSYAAVKHDILPGVEHRVHPRIEQPSRKLASTVAPAREENAVLQVGKTGATLPALAFGLISQHFQPRRHRMSAGEYRATLQGRFQTWSEVTAIKQTP